jgi:CxxC-x17-CxxC domain-containing protein
MSVDDSMTCQDCGRCFTFTRGEQRFYARMGFSPTTRYAVCRPTRKATRSRTSGPGSADDLTASSRRRETFSTSCARCGLEARVRFERFPNRRVYCSACFEERARAARAEAAHS